MINDIINMGWDSGDENLGWYNVNCRYLTYSLRIEDGLVKHAIKDCADEFTTVYPYRYNARYGTWDNVIGVYKLPYFKRLLKAGKIIFR